MKKTIRFYQIALVILFSGVILISYLNDFFRFYKVPEISQTEKRKVAAKPVFDISKLDPYPGKYENYFNDQFPFRQDLNSLNALLTYYLFHQSSIPDQVEIGKDGWFFIQQKESQVFRGKFNLNDQQVNKVVQELHSRALFFEKKGIRFYVAIAPMKPEIYPEKLPVDFKRAPSGTLTDKVVKAINADPVIPYIDLKEPLLNAKKQNIIYYLTDTHWNPVGAFCAYTTIINRIRQDFPEVKPVTEKDFQYKFNTHRGGNLSEMIGMSGHIKESELTPVFKKVRSRSQPAKYKIPDWASPSSYNVIIKSTGDTTLPSVVIIRDSFGTGLMPFLDESFNTNTYVFDGWWYKRNETIIAEKKPDIVLLLIFEPNLGSLIGVY
jgi:alginate O-acetyltransferase complex protein AlgJ